jgi:hypothetical protein
MLAAISWRFSRRSTDKVNLPDDLRLRENT